MATNQQKKDPVPPLKLCIGCKHMLYSLPQGTSAPACSHPSLIDPVYGKRVTRSCYDERGPLGQCGIEARNFELKG